MSIRFRFAALYLGLVAAALWLATGVSAAPAGQAQHGLRGHYYISNLAAEKPEDLIQPGNPLSNAYFQQVWFDPNDFRLPRPVKDAAVTRVDAQIAFGSGSGFASSGDKPVAWIPNGYALPAGWPNPKDPPWNYTSAVTWKGYIHLPKAGTYYFATVSNGPSAVYLNQARAALNGKFGGMLNSDAFTFAKDEVQSFAKLMREDIALAARPEDAYVIPVTVDAPRDLAIQVDYSPYRHFTHWAYEPYGIDLLWVTPDSPRGTDGKPVAQIVPSDALYVDPPGPIEKPTVDGASSTITSDFFYFPVDYADRDVTVQVRLTDANGKPVAGKQVRLAGVVSFGEADKITQPDKPTDQNGIAVAKLRPGDYRVAHESTLFAVDVTDLVNVAQVAHVNYQRVENNFLPDTFSPYYDANAFSVAPLPLIVGRPVTIKVPLMNKTKFAAELTATFKATDWNIGVSTWSEIGQVDNIKLQPGETRVVSITWTPQQEQTHQCFRIEISGHYTALNAEPSQVQLAALLPLPLGRDAVAPALPGADSNIVQSMQRNIGAVTGCTPQGMALQTLLGGGIADECFGTGAPPQANQNPKTPLPPLNLRGPSPGTPGSPQASPPIANSPLGAGKNTGSQAASSLPIDCEQFRIAADEANRAGNEAMYKAWLRTYQDCVREQGQWNGVANDPPDSSYQQLAIAPAATPAGYIEAVRVSMERYRAAQEDGDIDWMARHLSAMDLYFKQLAEAERRVADADEKQAQALPADDPSAIAQMQKEMDPLLAHLAQSGSSSAQLKQLQDLGLSSDQARAYYAALLALPRPVQVGGGRGALLDAIALRRRLAEAADKVAALAPNAGQEGALFAQSYLVGNPHDRTETVDLFIRPISIPPDWKLAVVRIPLNANGQPAAPSQPEVKEVEPSKHYAVVLPAKGQVRVASVLVPVGPVGVDTTVRWAVEGKIGDELIGGMVHEMDVPYIVPNLQLPPVGSSPQASSSSDAETALFTALGLCAGVAVVLLGAGALFFARSRRHRRA